MGFKFNPLGDPFDLVTSDKISSGSGAPASAPSSIGLVYIDTSGSVMYFSVGTSSPSDWIAMSSSAANYDNILTDGFVVLVGHDNVLWE